MAINLIMLVLVALFILVIPVCLGVYVYKDAIRRGMPAGLWTLAVLLIPGMVGLIIYMIVRGNHSDVICPACEKTVSDNYAVCPYCGRPLKLCCGQCQTPVDFDWTHCPKCGSVISPQAITQFQTPGRKKDKGLRVLVICLIAVPLLLGVIIMCSLIGYDAGSTIAGHPIPISSMEGYHRQVDDDSLAPEIKAWLAECDAQGENVYLLRLSLEEMRAMVDEYTYETNEEAFFCYVYINKGVGENGLMGKSEVDARTLYVSYSSEETADEALTPYYELSEFYASLAIPKVTIFINGKSVQYVECTLQ